MEQSALLHVATGLGLAMAMAALIGLERERHSREKGEESFGGVRTFPLIALAGSLSALLSEVLGPWAILPAFVGLGALLTLSYWRQLEGDERSGHGITAEVSAMLAFGLGLLPFVPVGGLEDQERLLLTAFVGGIVMALMALREPLHQLAESTSREDLQAAMRFVLLAAVVLPLLPDEAYGPYDTLNPFKVGVVVVLIAGISFGGYVAVRALGARKGIGLTAVFGGLVSSTAVTLTFSGRGRSHPNLARTCALAIVLASTIMFPRVWVELAVIRPSLVVPLLAPLGAMLLVGAAGCVLLYRRGEKSGDDGGDQPTFHNPFRLSEALKLGALYAVIRLVAAAAHEHLGEAGLHASAVLAGITDVDAITISIGRMHSGGLETGVATLAITLAAVSNTLTKTGMALVLGGRRVGVAVACVLLPAGVLGLAVALLMR